MDRVLVTGMSGLIGSAVRRRLEGKYELVALNRRTVPGVPTHCADVSDMAAIRPAFEGVDAVIHLAGALGDNWEDLLRVNVIGTYNVYEAAREAGVRRVVYASSTTTVRNYELDEPYRAIVEGRFQDVPVPFPLITHESPPRPHSVYSCTKLWGEALGRHYADTYGLSVICLRFGSINEQDRPDILRKLVRWQSQRDSAQAVQCCLEAPEEIGYGIFMFNSDNRWSYRDNGPARKLLGYRPLDSADDYFDELTAAPS